MSGPESASSKQRCERGTSDRSPLSSGNLPSEPQTENWFVRGRLTVGIHLAVMDVRPAHAQMALDAFPYP